MRPIRDLHASGASLPVRGASGDAGRNLRIDFLRGLALLFIFVDHVPDSLLSLFTLRSVAFADAAELFFFLSGFLAAMVYGRMAERSGYLSAAWKVWRRVWVLYVAQIILFVFLIAEVSLAIAGTGNEAYSLRFRIDAFLAEPGRAIVHALLLRYQPAYLDILPVHVLLLGTFPFVLMGLARNRWLVLVPSAALYAAVQVWAITVPSFPAGDGWFFNPFAWQFVFILGASLGHPGSPAAMASFERPWLRHGALVFAAMVALMQLPEALRMVFPHLPSLRPPELPLDKGALEPLRLLSFFAIAILVRHHVPAGPALSRLPLAGQAIRCGRHSLHIFAAGVLLSVAGGILAEETGHSLLIQTLYTAVGIAGLFGFAAWLDSLGKGGSRLPFMRMRRNQPT